MVWGWLSGSRPSASPAPSPVLNLNLARVAERVEQQLALLGFKNPTVTVTQIPGTMMVAGTLSLRANVDAANKTETQLVNTLTTRLRKAVGR